MTALGDSKVIVGVNWEFSMASVALCASIMAWFLYTIKNHVLIIHKKSWRFHGQLNDRFLKFDLYEKTVYLLNLFSPDTHYQKYEEFVQEAFG